MATSPMNIGLNCKSIRKTLTSVATGYTEHYISFSDDIPSDASLLGLSGYLAGYEKISQAPITIVITAINLPAKTARIWIQHAATGNVNVGFLLLFK